VCLRLCFVVRTPSDLTQFRTSSVPRIGFAQDGRAAQCCTPFRRFRDHPAVATTGPKRDTKVTVLPVCRGRLPHLIDACALYPTVMREMVMGGCRGSGC